MTDTESVYEVLIPSCISNTVSLDKNPLRQVLVREQRGLLVRTDGRTSIDIEDGRRIRVAGRTPPLGPGEIVLIIPTEKLNEALADDTVLPARWVGDLALAAPEQVVATLGGASLFQEADPATGHQGLRTPQLGALHSVLGYWTTSPTEPATVVMPTGTGKTETMLALLATGRIARLLVIVPSDALRSQIGGKFETFGILQSASVISRTALRPIVGQVRHGFTTVDNAEAFARQCNVVVTTPQALNASAATVRAALLACFSHLFVDESHHVAAPTWRQIRDEFIGKPVVQFTATPFREDGRHVDGRLVYHYPLRSAQQAGYFSPIDFISVLDLGDHDRAVAARAVKRLRDDLDAGRDHLLMARVGRIGRAGEVLSIYEEIAPDLAPVVIHSNGKIDQRVAALQALRERSSRIIVCVNMLGEGFDLPELKVAAVHDPHKSLGVTLQFIGRFARPGAAIGDASVVVGRPSGDVDPNLRRLYAEDADWNAVIRDLSEHAVGEVVEVSEFEATFGKQPEQVAMRSLLPKMSTVVYRTTADDWNPHGVLDVFPEEELLTFPIAINQRDHVAWFVTRQRQPVSWGELITVEDVTYHLYVVYWDASTGLLYINSSNNGSLHAELAGSVGGTGTTTITGEHVYRVMASIARLVPTNVGLLDIRNRSRRFSFHVGADVSEGFPVAEAQTKTKTNIFAYGFEEGERVSVGASLKGRIWSHRTAPTVKHWVDWCKSVGAKITDEGISVDEVMRHFIRPQVVEKRPELVPLALEWPWELLSSPSEDLRVEHAGVASLLIDVDFKVIHNNTAGPIRFSVSSPDWSLDYELTFGAGGLRFAPTGVDAYLITKHRRVLLSAALTELGLIVHFERDTLVVPPALLLRPERELPPFDPAALTSLDWTAIDLTVEIQGTVRRPDSIQARVITYVGLLANWDVIIDDHGNGEVADVVAMRTDNEYLHVHLVHCKKVSGGVPRAQVEDLYEVCGQAQKSVHWRRNVGAMVEQLIRRERERITRNGASGILLGDAQALYQIMDKARLRRSKFTIAIAQPGLSKQKVSDPQLELLASTQTYAVETAWATFECYCNS
jgi:superfamily II DNA or RNA helicase